MLYFTLTLFVQSTIFSTSGSYGSSLVDRIPAFLISSGSWQRLEAKDVAISPKQHSLRKRFRELWEGKPKSHHLSPFPEIPTENQWISSVCVCVFYLRVIMIRNKYPRGSPVFEPSQLLRRISSVMENLYPRHRIYAFSIWKMKQNKQIANT